MLVGCADSTKDDSFWRHPIEEFREFPTNSHCTDSNTNIVRMWSKNKEDSPDNYYDLNKTNGIINENKLRRQYCDEFELKYPDKETYETAKASKRYIDCIKGHNPNDRVLFKYIDRGDDCKSKKEPVKFDVPDFSKNRSPLISIYNLGLALSGGGTRSASFSIGVLKGLHDADILNKVDVISSVSGGGYANYWYMMHEYYQFGEVVNSYILNHSASQDDGLHERVYCSLFETPVYKMDDIFRTATDRGVLQNFRFQRHVSIHSDLLVKSTWEPAQYFERMTLFTKHIISLPFHWVLDGIFEWGYDNSPYQKEYESGIERTYGLVSDLEYKPLLHRENNRSQTQYYNSSNYSFIPSGLNSSTIPFWSFFVERDLEVKRLYFQQYKTFLKYYNNCKLHPKDSPISRDFPRIPFPIINATYSEGADTRGELRNSVFTFTPLKIGADELGYTKTRLEYFDRIKVVDEPHISEAISISGAALDANAREFNSLGDFGLWALNGNLGRQVSNPTFLSDDLNQTIVNKNTRDKIFHGILPWPLYKLKDQFSAKRYLRLSDGGHTENLGLYSLIIRAVPRIIVVDAEQDHEYGFEALNRLNENLKKELNVEIVDENGEDIGKKVGAFFNQKGNFKDSVMKFSIKGYFLPDGKTERKIEILYVKLSIDTNLLSQGKCAVSVEESSNALYPCTVFNYYQNDKINQIVFPHNSTADIYYEEEQYRAYRDLGAFIVKQRLFPMLQKEEWVEKIKQHHEYNDFFAYPELHRDLAWKRGITARNQGAEITDNPFDNTDYVKYHAWKWGWKNQDLDLEINHSD